MIAANRFWERLLGGATARALRRPWGTVAVALAIALAAGVAVATRLELRTSNLDLVDADLPEVARFRAFAADFGSPNVLVVVLEGGEEIARSRAAERCAAAIAPLPGVRAVLHRLPFRDEILLPLGQESELRSRDGTLQFLFVQPDDPDSAASTIAAFVAGVRGAVGSLGLERQGIRVGYTGLPQYALDDRDVVRRDISRLSGVSFVLVLGIFAVGFRGWREPALAMAVLAWAALVTAGVATFVPGHLTLVSAFCFSILFGLGIDFGVHVLGRARQLREEGSPPEAALVAAVRFLAPGLGTGAATTAASFLLLTVSGFRGFAELGALAGLGVLLALAGMVTLLPAAELLLPAANLPMPAAPGAPRTPRSGRRLLALARPAVALPLLAGALALAAFAPPPFDGDYLDLQPADSETVRLEREMVARSDFAAQFAVFVAGDEAAAGVLIEELRREPTVGAVRGAAEFAPLLALDAQIPGEWERFRALYVAADGRQAVYAFPAGDIWEPGFQREFLDRMRTLDPEATGMPFLGRFFVERSRRALRITGALAAAMLLALVLLDLSQPWRAALAVAPTFVAIGAMLGAMRLLGVPFNPLNVLALPIVLGVAEDSGVHLVHRFVAEGGDLARTLAGAGRTVLLCGATTLVGFGALAFAHHRGLASFALALTLGVGVALALSLLVLPWALRALGPRILRDAGHA